MLHNIAIIGAGQLGSRHLQGVKQSNSKLEIWAFDPCKESLAIAEERYNQVNSDTSHIVHFIQSIDEIPYNLDIVIIATSSKPRFSITKKMLLSHNIKYLILEKFLFQRLSDYSIIEQLIQEKNVKAYVNCPRRMFDSYQIIKENIDNKKTITMSYANNDWGLCCNSIHYIDIFMYLCNGINYELDIDGIEPKIIKSKREGYVELLGDIKITTKGNCLTLGSYENFEGLANVEIINGNTKITYNESNGDLFINDKIYSSPIKYQSTLSGILVDELIDLGSCRLSSYQESAIYHEIFLEKLIPYINQLQGIESDSCPIT